MRFENFSGLFIVQSAKRKVRVLDFRFTLPTLMREGSEMLSTGSILLLEGLLLDELAESVTRLCPLECTKVAPGMKNQSHSPCPTVASIP